MRNIITGLLLILTLGGAAQTGSIKGTVLFSEDKEAVPFATVSLEGTKAGALTNIEGAFELNGIAPGSYMIIVMCVGFDSVKQPVTITAGKITEVRFELVSRVIWCDVQVLLEEPLFTPQMQPDKMDVRILDEIPFTGRHEDIMFIVPALYEEPRGFGTIDVLQQAGAYRINFPEPKSAR